MNDRTADELAIWQTIMERADRQLGKARAEALRADLEQVVAEISRVSSWPVTPDDGIDVGLDFEG
jgi:hypothetical protein